MSIRPEIGPEPVAAEYVDLRGYLDMLRRQRRLIAIVTVGFLVAAGAYTFLRTPVYTATAKVVVRPTLVNLADVAPAGPVKLVSLPTEADYMTSTDVATLVAKTLNWTGTPQGLLKHVSVDIPTDAQVLAVSFSDPSPSTAQRGAIAFAESYLSFRQTQAENEIAQRRLALDEQIGTLENKISDLNKILAQMAHGSAAGQDALARRDQLTSQIELLQAQITDLGALNTNPGQVVSRPLPPGRPSSPNHVIDLGLGLFLGLFVGAAAGFVRSRVDPRLRERTTLEEAIGVPVLAVIPRILEWRNREAPMLVTLEEPKSPAAEAYRALRPALLVAAAQQSVKTLMVVSPLAGEGKTTTAANLAVVLAQADKRVWLVSADLRKPRVHEFFGLDGERGLATVLGGQADAWDVTQQTHVPNLWVLPSGTLPENPAELLQSDSMGALLRKESEMFDFVILDCPPVLAVADSLGLAPLVDAVLFVADAGSTRRDAVDQAREQLEQVMAPLLAAVLNDHAVEKSRSYYGYGYGDGKQAPPTNLTAREKALRSDPAAS